MDISDYAGSDHMIPDDFLSWILLDLDSGKSVQQNPPPINGFPPVGVLPHPYNQNSYESTPLVIAESVVVDPIEYNNSMIINNYNMAQHNYQNAMNQNFSYQHQHGVIPHGLHPNSMYNSNHMNNNTGPQISHNIGKTGYQSRNTNSTRKYNSKKSSQTSISVSAAPQRSNTMPPVNAYLSTDDLTSLQDSLEGEGEGDSTNDDTHCDDNGTQSKQDNENKRKLPRNRDLAKACRKRQRDKIEEIENKIKILSDENKELQAHINNVTQRTTEVQRQRIEMERVMSQKVEEMSGSGCTADGTEIDYLVKKFVSLYSDYGEYRGKEVSFHLDQLEKLIVPTKTTKFCIWALQQGETGNFNEAKSSLFATLTRELEITPDQANAIRGHRDKIQTLLQQLSESLNVVEDLRTAIRKKHSAFDELLGKIQAEATSPQIVRFLLWITKNAAQLAKAIPDFERSVPHIPQESFLKAAGMTTDDSAPPQVNSTDNSSSSTQSSSML